jgi:hypothetical protein
VMTRRAFDIARPCRPGHSYAPRHAAATATITQLATIVTAFRCPETPHSHVLRLDTLSSTLKLQAQLRSSVRY